MKVIRGYSTYKEQSITSPFPNRNGIFIEFRGGNFVHPLGNGKWFEPPYFDKVINKYIKWPIIPFISWKFGKHGGYIGAKAYGVDSPAYKHWLPEEEVYEGSQAIMFSVRPFATLEE